MRIRDECDLCRSDQLIKTEFSESNIEMTELCTSAFRVTNKDYGLSIPLVRCTRCNLVQSQHVLDVNTILRLYQHTKDDEYLIDAEIRGRSSYKQIIGLISKHAKKRESILEIGSGSGALLNMLKNDFNTCVGIEPSEHFSEYARNRYGVNVVTASLETFQSEKVYNVIIALDVIEHVVSPRYFIHRVKQLLSKDGVVILSTPNKKSCVAKLLGKKWWHIRPPHVYYCDDDNITQYAACAQLTIVEKQSFYWELPTKYVIKALQQWMLGEIYWEGESLKGGIKINCRDSSVYVFAS